MEFGPFEINGSDFASGRHSNLISSKCSSRELLETNVDGNPGKENAKSDSGISRIFVNRVEDNEPRRRRKSQGSPGMAWNAEAGLIPARDRRPFLPCAKDKNATGGQTEEEPIHDNHIAENLLERAEEHHRDGHRSLKDDCGYGSTALGAETRDAARKHPILGHCEVYARKCQHGLAEKADR